MDSIETLIPDHGGNHLVVVLCFYDDTDKVSSFQIPEELTDLDIADISISKLEVNAALNISALFKMCEWLTNQFLLYPNAVFSFICSTDNMVMIHKNLPPEQYRWNLFEALYRRYKTKLTHLGVKSKEIIVGPHDYQTFARVFYRDRHAPIIHLVTTHLTNKYNL